MSRVTGNVKWYDSKKGYGFITLVTPELDNTGNDFFVHYSNINISEGNFRRLFPGEYVEFEVGTGEDGRPICTEVSGLHGGLLLCENENHRFKIFPRRDRVDQAEEAEEEAEVEEAEEAEAEEAEAEDQ